MTGSGLSFAVRANERITIELPIADDSLTGAGAGSWEEFDTVWAEVKDVLPSRGEKLAGGINLAARPARVRIRFREDVTPAMRFVLGTRIMQIIGGPAEIGRRDELEFMVEDYSSAGNPA